MSFKGEIALGALNSKYKYGFTVGDIYRVQGAGNLVPNNLAVVNGAFVEWTSNGWEVKKDMQYATSENIKSVDEDIADLQEQIDDIAEKAGSGYTPKGPASVATLNGLTGQENGWLYTMTDAGTLTDGSLAVTAGDTVAWDATNSVWYKAMDYTPRQYGTNEIKNLPTTITAFRTGDVIAVDGPSGTAKMSKDDLLKKTAENALGSIRSLNNTATKADLVAGNYLALDGSAGTKKIPAEIFAANNELSGIPEFLIGGIVLEQGGYTNGKKVARNDRVRLSAPLIPPFKISLNDGYVLNGYQILDFKGNFLQTVIYGKSELLINENDGKKYLVYAKASNDSDLSPSEDIISTFDYPYVSEEKNEGYNPIDNSNNTKIDGSTGAESYRKNWVVTGYLKVSKDKSYRIYSSDHLLLRNYLFVYDSDKNFVKSIVGSSYTQNIDGMTIEILVSGIEGYVRLYTYQGNDGSFPNYASSLVFEEIKQDSSPIILNKLFGNEPNEKHIISREETYQEILENHFDVYPELKKFELGQSWQFGNKSRYTLYAYEYAPHDWKKTILITANTHGGEREGVYALAEVVRIIIECFKNDERVDNIRKHARLLIVPSDNPFGYMQDLEHYQIGDWNWRKYQGNAQGTNNNRNWDFAWANVDVNQSSSDYVGDDAMKSENNLVFEKVILPNVGKIDAWFDLHQGTDYANRYWLSSYVSYFSNPLYPSLCNMLKKLCEMKRTLNTYGAFTTEYGGKAAQFGTNVLGVPSFTLENNSLPGDGRVLVNYSSPSVTNFAEYVINMIHAVMLSVYNANANKSTESYFRSHLLTAPASKMYGDMYTDDLEKIYDRFDKMLDVCASLTKSNVEGLGDVYVIDNGNNPPKDLILVGGDKFKIDDVEIWQTAQASDERTQNVAVEETLALGTKNIYMMLRLVEEFALKSNSDMHVENLLNQYRIHIIPVINQAAYTNRTTDSLIDTDPSDLVAYAETLNDVKIIYFDETSVNAGEFTIGTTRDESELKPVLDQVKADTFINAVVSSDVSASLDAVNEGNVFKILFSSNAVLRGYGFGTEHITTMFDAVVNLANL